MEEEVLEHEVTSLSDEEIALDEAASDARSNGSGGEEFDMTLIGAFEIYGNLFLIHLAIEEASDDFVNPYTDITSNLYSIQLVAQATDEVSKNHIVGQGAFGNVYECRIDDIHVAVKRLTKVNMIENITGPYTSTDLIGSVNDEAKFEVLVEPGIYMMEVDRVVRPDGFGKSGETAIFHKNLNPKSRRSSKDAPGVTYCSQDQQKLFLMFIDNVVAHRYIFCSKAL
ncbi:zinc finger BED domain-containing protein RICESLEEPER 2 [Tanacetum coccineum]